MRRTDVTGFLERDWSLVERVKANFWIEQSSAMTPSAALQLGDELRSYVRTVRPDWPDTAERDADLSTHARVSDALRYATNYGSGPAPGSAS